MKLTLEQIKSLMQGALYFEEGPSGGIIPRRFTQAQMNTYSTHEAFSIRSHATSGICIACQTDAQAVKLSYSCTPGSSRDVYGFDLMLNGQLHAHLEDSVARNPSGEWNVALPAGEKEIKIFLPCLAGAEILGLELDSEICKPLTPAKTILFLGDSIMQGYTTRFPSLSYPVQISLEQGTSLINQAIGGETFRPVILDEYPGFTPDLIMIAYGTNDWSGKPQARFEADAAGFIGKVRAIWPETPVVILTPIWRGNAEEIKPGNFHFTDVHDFLTATAAQYDNMYIIPGKSLFPAVPELMEPDRLHPIELGFIYYAKRLNAELKKLNLI